MTSEAQNTRDVVPPAETEREHIQASPSSAVGPPTTSLQQGDGNRVPADQVKKPESEVNQDSANINAVGLPPHSPTFKEQVYGYARLIRGKVLGQPGVKEQGEQVLRGEQGIPLRRGSQSSK